MKFILTARNTVFWLALLLGLPLSADNIQSRDQFVFGAGPSTVIVTEFFQLFEQTEAAEGYHFTVPPKSVKHAGGIRASTEYLFGRTGRPLSDTEKEQGKHDLFLGRVPTGFVVGENVSIEEISLEDLDRILRKKISNWSEIGGPDVPIVLAGREKTEAVLMAMAPEIPALLEAEFDWEFNRDHALVNFISSPAGANAIGFGALANFKGLNILSIKDHSFGVPLGLVVDNSHADHPVVAAARNFAQSSLWKETLPKIGFGPYP